MIGDKKDTPGNPGQEAMLDVCQYLWWPHIHKDIVNLAEECTD